MMLAADDVDLHPGKAYAIAPSGTEQFEPLTTYLKARPKLCVEVQSDKAGSKRANEVKSALTKAKITCVAAKVYPTGKTGVEVVAVDSDTKAPLAADKKAATLSTLVGDVKTHAQWDADKVDAKADDAVFGKTAIVVGAGKSRAELTFGLQSRVQVWADSEGVVHSAAVAKRPKKDSGDFELTKGTVYVRHKDAAPFFVKTPVAMVKVAGPRAKIIATADKTTVVALEGKAWVMQGKGIEVPEGQGIVVPKKGPAPKPVALPAQPEATMPSEGQKFPVAAGEKISFSWKPSTKVSLIEVAGDSEFAKLAFVGEGETDAGQLDLEPGTYYWQVTAVGDDHLESLAQGPRGFTVERKVEAAPAAAVVAPATPTREPLSLSVPAAASEQMIETTKYDVTGDVKPVDAAVTVNGTKVQPDANGHFTLSVDVTPGDNTIVVEAADGEQKTDAKIQVKSSKVVGPNRFGLSLAPIVPLAFRTEVFGLELQLQYAHYFNDYVAFRIAAGVGATSSNPVSNPVPAFSAFWVADAGILTELCATGAVIPYFEINALGLWVWNQRKNYPDGATKTGDRLGRAQAAYAPNVGFGLRFLKDGPSMSVGVNWRVIFDGFGTSGEEAKRFHNALEIKLGLTFN